VGAGQDQVQSAAKLRHALAQAVRAVECADHREHVLLPARREHPAAALAGVLARAPVCEIQVRHRALVGDGRLVVLLGVVDVQLERAHPEPDELQQVRRLALLARAERVPVVLDHRRVTVVRYEHHVGVVQHARAPVGIEDPADRGIGDLLQVPLHLGDRRVGDVGVEVDAGKVDGLQVRDAVALEGVEEPVHGTLVERAIDVALRGLVVHDPPGGGPERGGHVAERWRDDQVRTAVDQHQRDVRAERAGSLVQRGDTDRVAEQPLGERPDRMGGPLHRVRPRCDVLQRLARVPFVARHTRTRRRLAREDRGPCREGGARQHAQRTRHRVGVSEDVLALGRAPERGHVRHPPAGDHVAQLLVAHAVEREEEHPLLAADRVHRLAEHDLASLAREVQRLARRARGQQQHRARDEQRRHAQRDPHPDPLHVRFGKLRRASYAAVTGEILFSVGRRKGDAGC
jgi:hypothetical protein